MRKLDVSRVRIYSYTKRDIVDALDLIGKDVFLSDYADFRQNIQAKLTGVICAGNDDCPFFHRSEKTPMGYKNRYKYFVLAKDVLPEEFRESKIDKAAILKLYEETIQTGTELSVLLSSFDSNKVFSYPSFALLWLLKENFCQNAKILETIAENELLDELCEIQRERFDITLTSAGDNHE